VKNLIIIVTVLTFGVATLFLTGCKSTMNKAVNSLSQKNTSASGVVSINKAEMTNAETQTPEATSVIMGNSKAVKLAFLRIKRHQTLVTLRQRNLKVF